MMPSWLCLIVGVAAGVYIVERLYSWSLMSVTVRRWRYHRKPPKGTL